MAVEDAELKATCINFGISCRSSVTSSSYSIFSPFDPNEMAAKVTEMAVVARVLLAA